MKLEDLLLLAHNILEKAKAPHAIIGAFALSAYGYQRATNDIDFLVDGDFRAAIEDGFKNAGFSIFHSNAEVLQLQGPGAVDIIFAKRPLSKAMLSRDPVTRILNVPVVDAEDIIGLKIQAMVGDKSRKFKDLGDIESICRLNKSLDWDRIKTYADLFGVWDLIQEIRENEKND